MRCRWWLTALAVLVVLAAVPCRPARAGDPNGWMFRRSYWSHRSQAPLAPVRTYSWSACPPGWHEPMYVPLAQGSVIYGYRYLNDTVHVGSGHDHVYHREYYWRVKPLW